MPDVALVQGASRGLGLAFVRCLILQSASSRVIATCRDPSSASTLQEFAESHPERVTLLRLDVTDIASLQAVAATVSSLGSPKYQSSSFHWTMRRSSQKSRAAG